MFKKKAKNIFLAWSFPTRRSVTLSESLEAKLIFLNGERKNIFSRIFHYFLLSIKTLKALKSEKTDFVFVQNPPIYSLFPVFLYAKWYGKNYIIDSHTGTFIVEKIHHHLFFLMHRYFSKFACALLLHNEDLSHIGKYWRAPYFILEDRIPGFEISQTKREEKESFNLVVICSYSSDEPIAEILQASQKLHDIHFYLTGDFRKLRRDLRNTDSSSITFTGYLEERKYIKLLQDADAIMVLTKRPYTLLCGAYEAVAVGRPLITSNLPLLRRHFNKGTIHVENTAEGIEAGIREGFSRLEHLRKESVELREEKEREWNEKFEILKRILYETTG
jgi:glycosyltransferase involved in cell wall biosynthesis